MSRIIGVTVGTTYNPEKIKGNAKSAYEVALDNGFEGTEAEWLASLKGDKGDTGAQGEQGLPGEKGEKGEKGDTGAQGIQGIRGEQGLPGEKGDKGDQGEQGIQGIQGEKGDKGDPGATGADGTSVTVESVSESTADGGSNVVTFSDGKTLTIKNGSKGSKGDQGIQGEKGETGATGAAGAKGDKGDTGATGATGADGYTPVRGTDYWTEADKAEIQEYIDNAIRAADIVYEETLYPNFLTLPYVVTFDEIPDSVELEWNTFSSDYTNKATLSNGDTVGCYYDADTIEVTWIDTTLTLSGYSSDDNFYIKVAAYGASGGKGEDGYTPIKGVDYWTEDDKAEINVYIDEQISSRFPSTFPYTHTFDMSESIDYSVAFDSIPSSVTVYHNRPDSYTTEEITIVLENGADPVGLYYDVGYAMVQWVDKTITFTDGYPESGFYVRIKALGDSTVTGGDAVTYTEQTKTDEEKAQARTNIGAADEAVVAKMKEDQPNLFSRWQTGNLLDNSKMIDGYRVTSSGELGSLASAIATDYIDISKAQGTHLVMYAYHKDLGAYRTFYRMCFYDANKTKLLYDESGNGGSDLTKSYVEIPEGAVYARVSYITKGSSYTYMVVRGTPDTPLDYYNYDPVEMVVVPKDLNEKLAVIDDMAKAKHQDDTEFTVTMLNNSATFSQNDITFVGDELWVSKENATYYTNGTMIFRYKVVNGEFTLVGTCDCDFGHLNTMDYCAANDCLIFGNGGNGTETTGNYFVVVKNPLALGKTALIADVGIKFDVNVGYKVQALWGGSNLGDNNIVYLLSNDSANITKVLLLKGDDGEFNGSYVTLESKTLETFGVQGADIFGDVLYIGGQTGGNEYSAVKEISLSDYSTIRTVKRKFYSADGTAITSCVQGIYVDQDAVWLCVNTGDTTKPVCLTKYRNSN